MTKLSALAAVCMGGLLVGGAYWTGWNKGKAANKRENDIQPPSAAEAFDLRSRCAGLGQKIMDENSIGTALAQDQVSHFDVKSNRCYVQLEVYTADMTASPENRQSSTYLYDGQTREMLAFYSVTRGKRAADIAMIGWRELAQSVGIANPGLHPVENVTPELDYITVQDFVSAIMKDLRTP